MIDDSKIMIVGGSGLLGTELRKLFPNAYAPASNEWDIREKYFYLRPNPKVGSIQLIIHCAALNKVSNEKLVFTNVYGTWNVYDLARTLKAKLVYISTDYVFDGTKALSSPAHRVKPYNYYGETKLAGEYAVKALDNYLILRGSFSPLEWPFDNAYTNHYTSKLPVNTFARSIKHAIEKEYYGVQHIAGVRQQLWKYASGLDINKKIEKSKDRHKYYDMFNLDFSLQNTII